MAMKTSEAYIKTRINRLKIKPVENAKLIKKWERKLYKWEKNKNEVSVSEKQSI